MDLSNFNLSKESLPTLAIILIIVGFIFSYLLSFIGKIIRFFALVLAAIFLILYFSGYELNSKSFQNLTQNIKSYAVKLLNTFIKDLNFPKNNGLNLEGKGNLENSNLTLPDIQEVKKTLIEVLNKTNEKR